MRTAGSQASKFVWVGWVPVFFLLFVFLLGGGARSDVASQPLLRGGSLLFAFWAATRLTADDWRRIRVPLALWFAATLWMAIQLVPLPADMWQVLPGREIITRIDRIIGQPDLWRPISLAPSQTMNSLLAMTVPLAALLVIAQVTADHYRRMALAVIAIACLSTLLGLVQLLSGAGSAAYLYRITNNTNMVGLFANSNHHALFLASAIALTGMLLRDELMRKRQDKLLILLLAITGIYLTAMTPFTGSRVGFVAGIVVFVAGYAMVLATLKSQSDNISAAKRGSLLATRGWLVYAPPVLVAAALGTGLALTDRTTSLSRALDQSVAEDIRVRAWPTVQSLIETYWGLGSGFGSFPGVFKIYEPDSLLSGTYFNHAHNDWAELLITGGLPFALIVVATLLWIALGFWKAGMRNLVRGHRGDLRLPVMIVVLVLAGASLAEYPLRVPSIQVLSIVLVVMLCSPKAARQL